MKKSLFIFIAGTFLTTGIFAQNVKVGTYALKYEVLPQIPLSVDYKKYTIEAYSGATDGVPLSSKFIYLKEKYIAGLENATIVTSQQGVFMGDKNLGGTTPTTTNAGAHLQISVIMNNIEVLDKKEFVSNSLNPKTNATQDYYNYKLRFKFPYRILVKDMIQNKTLIDTTIDTPKTTYFPADYRYNSMGDRVEFNGHPNKMELDLDYNNSANSIYQLSKQVLAKNIMDEAKKILNSQYGYGYTQYNIMLYRIKTKNKLFDISDTIIENIKNILDTVNYNCKKEKHLNWHCSSVKSIALKTIPLAEKMISDPAYTGTFEGPDKEEYIIKMKRNLIFLYMFNDELERAHKLLLEIEPHTRIKAFGTLADDDTITASKNLLAREIKLYLKHMAFFGFN